MARVFTAVDVKGEKLLDELVRVRDTLDLGFNPVSRENMHITLQFFKDAGEEEIEEIKGALRKVDAGAFEAEIEGVGAFPSHDYIRVVWAGAGNGRFHELYSQASDHGVSADSNNDFSPHVTLMRVKTLSGNKKRKLKKALDEFSDHPFGMIEVGEVKLYESRLGASGPEYSVLHSEKL